MTIEFTPVEHTGYNVAVSQRSRIETKVKAMTRLLARLGAPAPTVAYGPTVEIAEDGPYGRYVYDAYAEVTVTGTAARIAGWTPVASLDHTFVTPEGSTEALVSKFPAATEIDFPQAYRFRGPVCDHCGHVRDRHRTVVLVNETGEWIQVGTSCIREFLGVDPAAILWLASPSGSLFDDEFRARPETFDPDVLTFLTVAAEVTRIIGFARSSETVSTRDVTAFLVGARSEGSFPKEVAKAAEQVAASLDLEAGRTEAEAIVAWITAETSDSDFIQSASLAVRSNVARPKVHGILAALPYSFRQREARLAEIAARKAAEAARPASEWIGTVGQKSIVQAVITYTQKFHTDFGVSVRISGITADGERVTTFGSGSSLFDYELGDLVEWKGTVSGHTTHETYGKSTEFKRVTLLDPPTELDTVKVARPGDTIEFETARGVIYTDTVKRVALKDGRYVYSLETYGPRFAHEFRVVAPA